MKFDLSALKILKFSLQERLNLKPASLAKRLINLAEFNAQEFKLAAYFGVIANFCLLAFGVKIKDAT